MRIVALFAYCLCITAAASFGQTTQPEDWKAGAKASGWAQADIDTLARDKFLLGQHEFKQVFEPYISPTGYQFITSDSVSNAYNVLYEESVRQTELVNALRLSDILQKTWGNLAGADAQITGNPALSAAARRRARITVAVAISLLGDTPAGLDPSLAAIVAGEVRKAKSATAIEKPDWLGPQTPDFLGIDYSRFTPRGFYTSSPKLEGYFRAVAWMQAIPFRISDDEEFLSAVMIAKSATVQGAQPIDKLFSMYDQMLGEPDNPDLIDVAAAIGEHPAIDLSAGDLAKIRAAALQTIAKRGDAPQIGDQLRLPDDGSPAATVRIVPARRTPDALLFEHEMEHSIRSLPSGLDVAAALGSPYARDQLAKLGQKYPPLIDPATFGKGTLYCDYLYCLQALLDDPDKAAPKLFSSNAWREKNCQTVLAGWAQQRHTWQLLAKQNWMSLGEEMGPPSGFVEPATAFYSRMAKLCDRTANLIHSAEADDPNLAGLHDRWQKLSAICLRLNALAQKQLRGADFNNDDNDFITSYGASLSFTMLYPGDAGEVPADNAQRIADVYRNPNLSQSLEVGVGRPRALYILYPYHGGEVLCEGAVMPYYEFPHDMPMTDAEWKAMLDAKPAPKPFLPLR